MLRKKCGHARLSLSSRQTLLSGIGDRRCQPIDARRRARREIAAEADAHLYDARGVHARLRSHPIDDRPEHAFPIGTEYAALLDERRALPGSIVSDHVIAARQRRWS